MAPTQWNSWSHHCYLFSKQPADSLDPVDTWGRTWMMQSILRVTGTYMVIKILSMHIPLSLNTALSVPPPSSQLFQVQFFLLLLPCPVAVTPPLGHAFSIPWLAQSGRIIKSSAAIGRRGGYKRDRARLVLDRTPAPAGYLPSEITRTSEQPVEEGGQKEEGEREKKDRKSDWSREREGGSEHCSLAWTLCEAAVDWKRSLTHGDSDWATRLLLAILWKASCTQKSR